MPGDGAPQSRAVKLVHGNEVYRVTLSIASSICDLHRIAQRTLQLEHFKLTLRKHAASEPDMLTNSELQRELAAESNVSLNVYVFDISPVEGISFQANGYKVQTLRLVCNPFGEFLDTSSTAAALAGVDKIKIILGSSAMPPGIRIRFSLGAAVNAADLQLVPELIQSAADLANCCVNIPADELGLPDRVLADAAAACCERLARVTPRGEGNFNFTANFNMKPGCPYFPAGYNTADAGAYFAVGLEYTDLMVSVLRGMPQDSSWSARYSALSGAIQIHVSRLSAAAAAVSEVQKVSFAGFDTSAAPSKDVSSVCSIFQALGVPHFGSPGSLECSAFLTRVFKGLQGVDMIGFSGLMLTCLEDEGMAESAAAGYYDIRALLQYSSVCGIGLDCVPIPGDSTTSVISALMRDTGTLAFRLNKPLTVRLFPAPGKQAGDLTDFQSADLCNCTVFSVL